MALRIDTGAAAFSNDFEPKSPLSPTTPTTRERAISISQSILPTLRRTNVEKSPLLGTSNSETLQTTIKLRQESKKLLALAIARLQKREMPPAAYQEGIRSSGSQRGLNAVVRTVTGRGKGSVSGDPAEDGEQRSKPSMANDSDDDAADGSAFYTDNSCDLMVGLRDVLKISLIQGWDLFTHDDTPDLNSDFSRQDSTEKRWRRKRANSHGQKLRGARSRSRSASPSRDLPTRPIKLFEECLAVLSSVIEEDCRFQVRHPRPVRPPNALQTVTLDVAQLLIYTRRYDPRSIAQVGFTVLPAFRIFKPGLHMRLLSFYDEGVIAWMLYELDKLQGRNGPLNIPVDPDESDTSVAPPVVAITVDDVSDNLAPQTDRWKRWTRPGVDDSGLQSANAPNQDVAIYHLTSLIQPLLGAIFEHVEILAPKAPAAQRFHKFFNHLLQRKPDAYLDVLGVVAYHIHRARFVAVNLLSAYWPKALGHTVISRPITSQNFSSQRDQASRRSSLTRRMNNAHDHPYDHQFVPWKFRPSTFPVFFDAFTPNHCKVCTKGIDGFGLLCPFCLCAVHFDCFDYPEGSFLTEYSMESDPDIRKVAVHRFCHVLPQRLGNTSHIKRIDQHIFRAVNIFGMCLCFLCRRPLWGHVTQGMNCGVCQQFAHSSCLANTHSGELGRCRAGATDSASMTISYPLLRSTFVDHYRDMLLTESELRERTFEELAIFYSVLWTQLEILENGIALGSIIVSRSGKEDENVLRGFELHYVVILIEAYLNSAPPPVSTNLEDYLVENNILQAGTSLFFDWNILAFVASIVKLPQPGPSASDFESSELLSVSQNGTSASNNPDEVVHPYETATLAHLRDRLGESLQINSDRAAHLLLSHLHHLGLLERCDGESLLIDSTPTTRHAQYCFPLPFGLDISADVETLVAAIEGCLVDIDLSINEVGFLLLVRRFWPNGMLSSYTFRRLAKAILQWILSEDSNLAIILRDYVARGRILPGVRSGETSAWPFQIQQYRPSATPVASNGGDYVASRRALLTRYAAPWMLALHDLDVDNYGRLLFELLCEHAEDGVVQDEFFLGKDSAQSSRGSSSMEDGVLKLVVKICQHSVAFSVFDDLFDLWLGRVHDRGNYHEAVSSLPRLFTREDGTQRQSLSTDSRLSMGDIAAFSNVNPLQKLMHIALSSAEGYERGLNWLALFACSGVDIPLTVYEKLASGATKFQAGLADCAVLVQACLYSTWLRSVGRQELQVTIAILFSHLETKIVDNLRAQESMAETICFIRQSLAICLLLYGCDREYLQSQTMVLQQEIDSLPSRRKAGARASAVSDPIIVDPRIMAAIKVFLDQGLDQLSLLIVQFLYAFVSEASLVESYEADNFILRNSDTLSACVWESYAVQAPEICLMRASLLVRVLAVDPQPLQSLLTTLFGNDTAWEIRLHSALRLFRMILDVTSPAFEIEDRQWRPSVIEIFHHFFSLIWSDPREEVRAATDTWALTLLPAHLSAIARCWNEALGRATMAERTKLVNFLSQLRPHFPKWKVVTWEAVIEALLENDFLQDNGENGAAAAHLSLYGVSADEEANDSVSDPEHVLLRVSLVSLSLRMVADGIEIDIFSLLKIKDQLLRVLGFPNVSLIPSANGHTFHVRFGEIRTLSRCADPCIADLMSLFDSAQSYALSCSVMGGPMVEEDETVSLLIGSPFLDVLLGIFRHAHGLTSLIPLTLKNLLKCLIIAMQKHDFDSRPLKYLQGHLRESIRRVLSLLMDEEMLSQELRQLALSTIHIFAKRWPNIMGAFIFEALEGVSRLLLSLQYKQHIDDVLVIQGRQFLESSLNTFYSRGILHALFKKRLDDGFFSVLQFTLESASRTTFVSSTNGSLADVLLHDTLSRVATGDLGHPGILFTNINKFVETIHHARYTSDLLQFVGATLTSIAQRIPDTTTDLVDFSPLLMLCATLIQHNKAQSRDFLLYVETLVRVVLVRATLNSASLSRILQITGSLFRKVEPREQAFLANHVTVTILQTVSEALCGKLRVIPATLGAAIEAIGQNVGPIGIPVEKFSQLAHDGIQYLHTYSSTSPLYQDFTTCQNVAKMVLQAAMDRPDLLTGLSSGLDLRTWNLVLLAAIRHSQGCAKMLLGHFRGFTKVYYVALEQADVDISRAYVAVKLWLLLARQATSSDDGDFNTGDYVDRESSTVTLIWNELWPPMESVVSNLEQEGAAPNILLLASSSVADLILFVHQSHTVLSLELSSHIALLDRLRKSSRVEFKINRVLRTIIEPFVEVPLDTYISQIAAEMEAEEKLEIAKWQDSNRLGPDRMRRIVS